MRGAALTLEALATLTGVGTIVLGVLPAVATGTGLAAIMSTVVLPAVTVALLSTRSAELAAVRAPRRAISPAARGEAQPLTAPSETHPNAAAALRVSAATLRRPA
jgi:hypothetical protein